MRGCVASGRLAGYRVSGGQWRVRLCLFQRLVSGVVWLRGAAWRCGHWSNGVAAPPVTATASFAAGTMATACSLGD